MIEFIKTKYNIRNVTPLEGGYSFCDKYIADNYVLKVFDMNEYDHMIERVEFLQFLNQQKLRVPTVLGYGIYKDKCYQLFSYLKGETGEEICKYSDEVQFNIGKEAGKELKIYHSYKKPEQIDIYSFHKQKFEHILKEYRMLNLQFKYEDECIQYVNENLTLLRGRDTYHLHGDFHAENLCFNEYGYVGAYDFERNKKTDYVREFERTLYFTRQYSLEFVKGFLVGYEFKEYEVLKLYLVLSIFNSFVWAAKYYPEQLEMFDRYSKTIVEDFGLLKENKPVYLGE